MATADVDRDDSIVTVACYFYIPDEQNKVSRRRSRRRRYWVHDGAKFVNFWTLSLIWYTD